MRRMSWRGVKCSPAVLVGDLSELADQVLEDRAHLGIADRLRMEIDAGELLRHLVQHPALGQAVDLGVEVESFEDVTDRRGEGTGCRRRGSL